MSVSDSDAGSANRPMYRSGVDGTKLSPLAVHAGVRARTKEHRVTKLEPSEPLPSYGQAPRYFDQRSPQTGSVTHNPKAVARHQSPLHAAAHRPAQPLPSVVPVAHRRTSAERFW